LGSGEGGGKGEDGEGGRSSKRFPNHADFSLFGVRRQYIARSALRAAVIRTRDQSNWRTGEDGVRVTIADSGQGMSEKIYRAEPKTGSS
jgi:hypothetical protein